MASIESFEETARLDPAALRALLASGRPEQRVWAIWALALRNQDVVGLAQRTAGEPDPGVRRTLAVILASHGETDLLVALARHDPEIVVRASAMQLVTRLAAGGAIDRAVVLEAERREPAIQIAILAAIGAASPAFLVELAGRMLGVADHSVQLEAFEALVRIDTPATLERAMAWLGELDDAGLADACQRWGVLADAETIARAVAAMPRVRAAAVRSLRAPSWAIVERVAGDDAHLRIELALRPDVHVPLAALRPLLIDGPGARGVTAARRQLARLGDLPADAMELLVELREHCRTRQGVLRATRRKLDRGYGAVLADRSDASGARYPWPGMSTLGEVNEELDALAILLDQLDRLALTN